MNRTDRLAAILIQLQSRSLVKAQAIAERFGISLRTVYRDIRALTDAGVPVVGEPGVGYALMDGYRLPPVMFTREEALAFLTAEQLVARLADDASSAHYQSALYKVRAVLGTQDQDFLERIDGRIAVIGPDGNPHRKPARDLLQTILTSVARRRALRIVYHANSTQERTERTLEPIGTCHYAGYWHLIAYCRVREGYRDFRLDRIGSLSLTTESFRHVHPTLEQYLAEHRRSDERPRHDITLYVPQADVPYLSEQKYWMGYVGEDAAPGGLHMHFRHASLENFARWYLMMGETVRIVQPEALRHHVRQLLQQVAENLAVGETLLT